MDRRILRDETLSPYEFAMEEVNLALSQLAHAFAADDRNAIEEQCTKARRVHRRVARLYDKLTVESTKREALLGQLALLRSRIEECEGGKRTPARATVAKL